MRGKAILAAAWMLASVSVIATAANRFPVVTDDWPNWRGPRHDGISAERGLKTQWTTPIPLVWERTIGSAFSGFSCVGNRVYTCGTLDGQQTLLCLDADRGTILWQRAFEPEYRERQGGDGTRATPTVDGGRVYIVSARGLVLCCDAASGAELWKRQFDHPPTWGYSGSVLIEGDLAIVQAGGPGSALAAMNKTTGRTTWTCGDGPVGYATPYPFTFEGKRYIVGFLGRSALAVEAATGAKAWQMEWKTDWDVNAAAPIYADGHLMLSSGYGHGAIVLKLRTAGDALVTETVWESRAVRNKFQSCVLYEGHLYTSDERALKCVEFLTGREKWSVPRVEHATLVVAQGHLFILTEDGELLIAPATPRAFEERTRAKLLAGRCWTVPTLHRGRLYARDLERAVCFDLTDRRATAPASRSGP